MKYYVKYIYDPSDIYCYMSTMPKWVNKIKDALFFASADAAVAAYKTRKFVDHEVMVISIHPLNIDE